MFACPYLLDLTWRSRCYLHKLTRHTLLSKNVFPVIWRSQYAQPGPTLENTSALPRNEGKKGTTATFLSLYLSLQFRLIVCSLDTNFNSCSFLRLFPANTICVPASFYTIDVASSFGVQFLHPSFSTSIHLLLGR